MNTPYIVEAVRACLGEAYLVGGALRDSLMGFEMEGDFDFSTPLPPQEIKARLEENGFKAIDYSAKYGTISTFITGTKVEITTFRQEEYTHDSRHPDVRFVHSLEEDLSRRDFTMNAIAHDGEEYIDPFNGQLDIINRKIKAVGDPASRFEEDPLRMLRAIRFVASLGFTLEANTFDSLFACAPLVVSLSGERVAEELDKIIVGQYWVRALSIGLETKLFERLFGVSNADSYIDSFLERIMLSEEKAQAVGVKARWVNVLISSVEVAQMQHAYSQAKLLNIILTKINERLKWPRKFSESLYEKARSEIEADSVERLEKQLVELQKQNDDRQYIVEEKILTIKLRTYFVEQKFELVVKTVKQIITDQNSNIAIRIRNGRDKGEVISESLPYALSVLKYYCACLLYKMEYIETADELNNCILKLIKSKDIFSLTSYSIADNDRAKTVEEALILLINEFPQRITGLSAADIMNANKYVKPDYARLNKIKHGYSKQLTPLKKLAIDSSSRLDVARLCAKIADMVLKINNGVKDKQYYEFTGDEQKWRALAAKSEKSFWQAYEKMNLAMDEVDKIYESEENSLPYKRMGQYIDNAQCLAHMLSIEKDILKKIELTRSITNNYRLASGGFAKNVPRYVLLKEWLILVESLLRSDKSESIKILSNIPKLTSYRYVDEDEKYVAENLPEIIEIRDSMSDIENFLSFLHKLKLPETDIKHPDLRPAVRLLRDGYIDNEIGYEIMKKVLQKQVNKDINIEPIVLINSSTLGTDLLKPKIEESEDMKLIFGGENEQVEFKSSWRYDIVQKQIDPTKEIKKSAIKAFVSFMNAGGGTLFIGVDDKGQILGLENADFLPLAKKNYGKLQLQDTLKKDIDNSLASACGTAASTLKAITFDVIEDKTIAVIKVKPSTEPVFYDGQLYVRSSSSSPMLNAEETYKFIKSRTTKMIET